MKADERLDQEIYTAHEFADMEDLHVNARLAAREIPGAIRIGRSWRIDMGVFRRSEAMPQPGGREAV